MFRCKGCGKIGPEYPCEPEQNYNKNCTKCHRIFSSQQCYENHTKTGCCWKYKYCPICKTTYQKTSKKDHICEEPFCGKCFTHHSRGRECHIEKYCPKERIPRYRILV